jgi:hypothetical protein
MVDLYRADKILSICMVAHLQEHDITKRILKRYNVVTKDQVLPGLLKQLDIETDREFLAAVDLLVCMQAQTFLGKHFISSNMRSADIAMV